MTRWHPRHITFSCEEAVEDRALHDGQVCVCVCVRESVFVCVRVRASDSLRSTTQANAKRESRCERSMYLGVDGGSLFHRWVGHVKAVVSAKRRPVKRQKGSGQHRRAP